MRKPLYLILILALALLLAACGGSDSGGGDPAAKAGEDLFAQPLIGTQPGCGTCHSLEADRVVVGPSLAGIAARAGSTISGLSAEDYIRQSILEPDAHLVEGFPAGTMPQVWGQELSEEQLNDIVAYLLTLK